MSAPVGQTGAPRLVGKSEWEGEGRTFDIQQHFWVPVLLSQHLIIKQIYFAYLSVSRLKCTMRFFGILKILRELYRYHHNFRTFLYSRKEAPSAIILLFPKLPLLPAITDVLPVSGFACSGHFVEMESYSMWPFVIGFFHLA